MSTDFFHWSDDFSVGVEEIDGQHKTLVSLINQLHTAIRERHGSKASREILDQLADYTRTHFLLEESLMRVSKYPGYAAHHAQHEDLIKQVTALQEKTRQRARRYFLRAPAVPAGMADQAHQRQRQALRPVFQPVEPRRVRRMDRGGGADDEEEVVEILVGRRPIPAA